MNTPDFQPRLVGFLCTWCAYGAADKAGTAQRPLPPNVHLIRVPCTGRIDPQFVLSALQQGADGVVVVGCHPGGCHYQEQNYRAVQRHHLLLKLLTQLGVDPGRCRLGFAGASEGEVFTRLMTDAVDAVRSLGPLRLAMVPPPGETSVDP